MEQDLKDPEKKMQIISYTIKCHIYIFKIICIEIISHYYNDLFINHI